MNPALLKRANRPAQRQFLTGQHGPLNLAITVSAQLLSDTGFGDEVVAMLTAQSSQAAGTITIEMAHALGFQIVAEGIEDGAILDALAALGCDYGQGWHIGKPVAWEAFVAEHLRQRQPRETAA